MLDEAIDEATVVKENSKLASDHLGGSKKKMVTFAKNVLKKRGTTRYET